MRHMVIPFEGGPEGGQGDRRVEDAPSVREYTERDVDEHLEETGLSRETFAAKPYILDRLKYLGARTGTMQDERRGMVMGDIIFEHGRRTGSEFAVEMNSVNFVHASSLLTDLGKSGSDAPAMGDAQRWVARMYAERGGCPPQTPVADFINKFFQNDEKAEMLSAVASVPGLTLESPMRDFWNIHAQYTFDLLRDSGLDPEIVLAAAGHHWIQGGTANPLSGEGLGKKIVNEETGCYQALGVTRRVDKRDIWVIILDKYEANITRAEPPRKDGEVDTRTDAEREAAKHANAVGWLRDFVSKNEIIQKLRDDEGSLWLLELFNGCINDLEAARPYERVMDMQRRTEEHYRQRDLRGEQLAAK